MSYRIRSLTLQGKGGYMENKQQSVSLDSNDLRGSDIYEVMKIIRYTRERSKERLTIGIREIKDFALKLKREGYLITKEKGQGQIVGDQFLDSPYFDFISFIWDYPPPFHSRSSLNEYFDVANESIKAGFVVTKQ